MEEVGPAVRLDDGEEDVFDKAQELGSRLLLNADRSMIRVADYSHALNATAASMVINGGSFLPVGIVATQRGALIAPLTEPWAIGMIRAAATALGDELAAVIVHGHFHQVVGPVPDVFHTPGEEEAWKRARELSEGDFETGQVVTQLFPFVYGQKFEGERLEVIFSGAYRSGLECPSAGLWRAVERIGPATVGIGLPILTAPCDGFQGLLAPCQENELPLCGLAIRLMDRAAQAGSARYKVTGVDVWNAMSRNGD
jgi:hypothetical protein